jgi:drug/metabolite transporter (DMT)-like permease
VGSGTFIGFAIILLDATPADSGLLPLVANRIASSTLLILAVTLVILSRKTRSKTPALPGLPQLKSVFIIMVAAGLSDVLANVAVLYGLRTGDLSVMSVLVALYPAGTILLASVVLKERIAPVQWFGLGLALVASTLLAA